MRLWRDGVMTDVGWEEVGALDWQSFGLVLGAGGMTGGAFEVGVLLALQWDHGVQPHSAALVVGTSAGSIGGTLLSLGFDAADIAAMVLGVEQQLTPRGRELLSLFEVPVPAIAFHRLLRPPTPGLMVQTAMHLARRRMRMVVLGVTRRGEVDARQLLHAFAGIEWAAHPPLKICVTDADDGSRVVLDADGTVPLFDAVAASCSVPGLMRPVECDGRQYVDGGVWSPTNADLAAGPDRPSTVVVLSPMSGGRSATVLGMVSSRFAARRLEEELRQFHPSQTVLVIEPTQRLSLAVVDDALEPGAVAEVVLGAFTGPAARG